MKANSGVSAVLIRSKVWKTADMPVFPGRVCVWGGVA